MILCTEVGFCPAPHAACLDPLRAQDRSRPARDAGAGHDRPDRQRKSTLADLAAVAPHTAHDRRALDPANPDEVTVQALGNTPAIRETGR